MSSRLRTWHEAATPRLRDLHRKSTQATKHDDGSFGSLLGLSSTVQQDPALPSRQGTRWDEPKEIPVIGWVTADSIQGPPVVPLFGPVVVAPWVTVGIDSST
ncbi:hypothetical protein CORC01_04931 [Colletotrichum orchidophilum]|uniref:Uncharacterized protein n=1 Tax=Colletotrichum orchidophilum TaxID=1209926 RepID=A0A1G4BEN5_9PEZI|nr:uncharacterized protein CORC01_04931 [Colletotrichum orchidophilum]OHE99795.1 hypothetical protein CORC01_04931 [Colletotrichum orchidophilum]